MGVGGALYNGIFGYLDVVTGHRNLETGIEKLKRCAKFFARCVVVSFLPVRFSLMIPPTAN